MKKIFMIIFLTFLLTGCYDYQELNNRAFITGFALDLVDEDFLVTYEIMNTKKSDSKEGESTKSYYVEGKGKTIAEAFQKANLSLNKEPTFFHVKALVLSEEVAKDRLPEILDYLIRDPEIYNIFYPVVSKDVTAKELIQTTSIENPVASEVIRSMIENNKASNTITASVSYEDFLNQMIDPFNDGYMNTVSKKDNKLELNGIAVFKEQKLQTFLDVTESTTFNALHNDSPNYYITTTCPNNNQKLINIDLYDNESTDISFKDNKIIFKVNLKGNIIEDNCNLNFRELDVYQELDENIAKTVKHNFEHFYELLQTNQTDILNIQEKYYKKYRQELPDWFTKEVEFLIQVKVNKNGLVFEVQKDE